jgi:lipopolysaccharide export system permease protein
VRIAAVFAPLILVLLGFPFVNKPLKTNTAARSVAFCFGVVLLYLLMTRLTISIGKNGHIAPILAAWAPNLLFLSVASFRLTRM